MPNVQHVRFHIQRVNKSETGSVLPVQRNGKGHVDEKEDQDTELVHTGIVFGDDSFNNLFLSVFYAVRNPRQCVFVIKKEFVVVVG